MSGAHFSHNTSLSNPCQKRDLRSRPSLFRASGKSHSQASRFLDRMYSLLFLPINAFHDVPFYRKAPFRVFEKHMFVSQLHICWICFWKAHACIPVCIPVCIPACIPVAGFGQRQNSCSHPAQGKVSVSGQNDRGVNLIYRPFLHCCIALKPFFQLRPFVLIILYLSQIAKCICLKLQSVFVE